VHGRVIRVVVADAAEGRATFRRLLDDEVDIVIVGEAASAREALALTRRLEPDVVLIGAQLPNMQGYRTAFDIRDELPQVETVIVAEPGQVALDLAEGHNLLLRPFSGLELTITLRYLFSEGRAATRHRRPFSHLRTIKAA